MILLQSLVLPIEIEDKPCCGLNINPVHGVKQAARKAHKLSAIVAYYYSRTFSTRP